jgi:hypothetical protein
MNDAVVVAVITLLSVANIGAVLAIVASHERTIRRLIDDRPGGRRRR